MRRCVSILPATISLLALLAACASEPRADRLPDRIPVAGSASLAGTQWRLLEFQSMDDTQGTTRPADRNAYRLSLGADGRALFRLDCNRGMGSWSATPAQDGISGIIAFSRLAVTKALCPPPSMGEKVERDTQYMRGYVLRDGKLSISLMADGGIYLFEAATGE